MTTSDFDILIKNAQVVTMNVNMDYYNKGFILIKNSKIIDLGSMEKFHTTYGNKIDYKEEIDAQNNIIIPGFVNSHGHFAMTLFRGIADDLPLKKWLNNYIWPIEANLQENDCYIGTQLAAIEMIQGGTTSACDMYFNEPKTLDALEEIGFRGVLGHGMLDFGDEEKRLQEITETKKLISLIGKKAKLCTPIISPHAPNTCSKEILLAAKNLSEEHQLPLQIHLAETKSEFDEIKSKHNVTPTKFLSDLDFLCNQLVVAHGIWLEKKDYQLLAKNNVKVAHNPTSNLKLGSGILDYNAYKKNKITIALGTDGASSNNNLSMIQELRLASLIHKGVNTNPELLPASEALKMATINGATALGLAQDIGSLEINKKADLAIIDIKTPNIWPPHDPYSLIAYSASDYNVASTIVNGQFVMKNREILTIDVQEVLNEARETIVQLIDNSKLDQFSEKLKFLK